MNLKLNKHFALIGLLALLLLTYFRENFLLAINASLASQDFDRSYSYWLSDFFREMSIQQLNLWKWGLTLFFSILMSLLTIVSIHIWFKVFDYFKISIIFFITVFTFVGCLGIIAYLFDYFKEVYPLLRKVLGVVQSPLPFFTFFVLFYFKNKKEE